MSWSFSVSPGCFGNIIDLLVPAGGRGLNLNMRAAFLEVVNDALGSVVVLVAASIVSATGWLRADAVASLVIGMLIVPRTVKLLHDSVPVLLESTSRVSTQPTSEAGFCRGRTCTMSTTCTRPAREPGRDGAPGTDRARCRR